MDTNKAVAGSGVLSPAYGRDYKNRAAVVSDLNAGKDFTFNRMLESSYINLAQLGDGPWQVRYGQNRKTFIAFIRNGVAGVK